MAFAQATKNEGVDTIKNLREVKIVDFKKNGTDVLLVDQIRQTNLVVTGISAEQISKGQDKDGADVIRRIQGVNLNDNRFIVIRGINERYNTTWLNSAGIPSSEPDKRSFSFDIIPGNMIDQILVYKTPSAELPGDCTGGMIKVISKTAAPGSSLTVGLNGYVRDGSTFQTMKLTQGSSTDFLGYDNGFRKIPAGIPAYIVTPSIAATELFKNTWIAHDRRIAPDVRFNIAYNKGFKLRRMRAGIISALNYDNYSTVFNMHQQEYDYGTRSADNHDMQYSAYARLSAIVNVNLHISDQDNVEFKNLFNQSGRSQSTFRTGTELGSAQKAYAFGYESKRIISSQLTYTHSFDEHSQYTVTAGRAYNERLDPDLRRIAYLYPPDTFYRANIPPGSGQIDVSEGATRYFSELREYIYSLNQNLKLSPRISDYRFEMELGMYNEYKSRNFSSRLFGYTLPVSTLRRTFTGLDVNEIFSTKYIEYIDSSTGIKKPVGFRIQEATNPSDSYHGTNLLYAPYIVFRLPVTGRLSVQAGARYEYNIQSLKTVVGVDSLNIDLKTDYVLPSANLKYDVGKDITLRMSYGKTINRPEFREWAPFLYYDFELLALTHGSLFPSLDHKNGYILQTASVNNYDISADKYYGRGEYVHAGLFYKHFTDPIEQVVESRLHRTGISREITFLNAQEGMSEGIEIEARKNLGFLSSRQGRIRASDFSLIDNITLVRSWVYTSNDSFRQKRPLQGQAPYIVNVGLFYEGRIIDGTLSYNVVGPKIFIAGGSDGPNTPRGNSLGELQRNIVDLSFRMKISGCVQINAGISDLLNQPISIIEDTNNDNKFKLSSGDRPFLTYRKGSYYTAGILIKI